MCTDMLSFAILVCSWYVQEEDKGRSHNILQSSPRDHLWPWPPNPKAQGHRKHLIRLWWEMMGDKLREQHCAHRRGQP